MADALLSRSKRASSKLAAVVRAALRRQAGARAALLAEAPECVHGDVGRDQTLSSEVTVAYSKQKQEFTSLVFSEALLVTNEDSTHRELTPTQAVVFKR